MKIPELENLGMASPFFEIAAELMGADRICFFGDQLFLKDSRSIHRTAFHEDGTYFHHEVDQCCTIWMPLDFVDRENGAMGYVHGSTGNTSASRIRRALAFRYLGNDIRYLEREGAPPDSRKSETLRNGDPIASPDSPQIWTKAAGYQRL